MNRQVLKLHHAAVHARGSLIKEAMAGDISISPQTPIFPDQTPIAAEGGYDVLVLQPEHGALSITPNPVNRMAAVLSADLSLLAMNIYRHRKKLWPSAFDPNRSFVQRLGPRPSLRKIMLNREKILAIWRSLSLAQQKLLVPNARMRQEISENARLGYIPLPRAARRRNHRILGPAGEVSPLPKSPRLEVRRARGEMARKIHAAMGGPVMVTPA